MLLSKRIGRLSESLTIAISSKAKEMKAAGKDVVIFSAGEPDFDTAEVAKNAVINAMNNGCGKYTPIPGTQEVLKAVQNKLKRDNDLDYKTSQIITNVGAKHTIFNVLECLIDEDDEVIIPSPYWVTYPEIVKFCGGKPVFIETKAENKYKMTANELKNAISPKTKALMLCSPGNPTGGVYSKSELEAIADVLKDTQIAVLADEIYEKIIFSGEFIAAASISDDMFKRTITINGLSKCGAMPGWRFGYAATSNDALAAAIKKLQSQSTSNISSIVQAGAIPVLSGTADDYIEKMRCEYQKRRDFAVTAINDIDGLSVVKPDGAFYLFVDCSRIEKDSLKFCMKLLEDKLVAVVPGIGFGMDGHFRISFACSLDELKKGIARLSEFTKSYK